MDKETANVLNDLGITALSVEIMDMFAETLPSEEVFENFRKKMRLLELRWECKSAGYHGLDWEMLHKSGSLCRNDYKVFDELKGRDPYEHFPCLKKVK